MRTGWYGVGLDAGRCTGETVVTGPTCFATDRDASAWGHQHLRAWDHLVIPSCLLLKTAKARTGPQRKGLMGKLMPSQRIAVRNTYLIATLMLASVHRAEVDRVEPISSLRLHLAEPTRLDLSHRHRSARAARLPRPHRHALHGLQGRPRPEVHGTGWTTDNAQGIETSACTGTLSTWRGWSSSRLLSVLR